MSQPTSAEELLGMLEFGNNNRTQHPTDANAQSSRSHAVFQVTEFIQSVAWLKRDTCYSEINSTGATQHFYSQSQDKFRTKEMDFPHQQTDHSKLQI